MFRVMYYNKHKEHHKSPTPPLSPSLSLSLSPSPPPPQMSPRISFSNDFVEQHMVRSYRDAPVSSDFEFSVSNYSMMSADELFSHGRLLPLKENTSLIRKTTTLRDELQVLENGESSENDGFSLRPPRSNSTRWKGFLGLRKSHIGSKKIDKSIISSSSSSSDVSTHQRSTSFPDFVFSTKATSQEMMNEGSSGSRNVEYRQ